MRVIPRCQRLLEPAILLNLRFRVLRLRRRDALRGLLLRAARSMRMKMVEQNVTEEWQRTEFWRAPRCLKPTPYNLLPPPPRREPTPEYINFSIIDSFFVSSFVTWRLRGGDERVIFIDLRASHIHINKILLCIKLCRTYVRTV